MPNQATLVQIIHDYLQRGEEIEDVQHELKKHCKPIGGVAAFEAIKASDPQFNGILTDLLDALSIGGCQLHLMPTNTALGYGYFNCYVWAKDIKKLVYIDKHKVMSAPIPLRNVDLLTSNLDALKTSKDQSSIHLTAKQIEHFITRNTESEHIPPTTDLELIKTYYDSPNLYVALTRIKRKHRHLELFVESIHDIKPENYWMPYLKYGALFAVFAAVFYYLKEHINLFTAWFERTMPLISQWLSQAAHILKNMPLIGMAWQGVPLTYAWYRMLFVESPSTDWDQSIKLFFKTIEHGFPIIGYLMCYFAAGAMTVPAISMFIAGSAIEIVHSIYIVLHDEFERSNNPPAPGTEYFSKTTKTRADNLYERGLWVSLTKFIANIFITTLAVILYVYPPSMVISVFCVVAGGIVGFIKNTTLDHIKSTYAHALQQNIKQIDAAYHAHQSNPDVSAPNIYSRELEQENRKLKQEQQAFSEQLSTSYMTGFKEGYSQGFNNGRKDRTTEETGIEPESNLRANSMWNRGLAHRAIHASSLVAANEEVTDTLVDPALSLN